jgi:hypothetical protein
MCDHKWIEDEASMRCFVGCIAGNNCNPKSHNSITYDEYCTRCNGKRRVNKNQSHKEYSRPVGMQEY